MLLPTGVVSGTALGDASWLYREAALGSASWSRALTAPGQVTPHQFLFFMCRALLIPMPWGAMPCSSTSKRRASRISPGCSEEGRACSPLPAFLGLHCWDRAKKAAKTRRSQLVMLLSVDVGDTWTNTLLLLLVLTRYYWSRNMLPIST